MSQHSANMSNSGSGNSGGGNSGPNVAQPQQFQQGEVVIALYTFNGNHNDLSFRRRDILTIERPTRDPNWYHAKRHDGKSGMIPANYVMKRTEVKLNAMPWFHGKLRREEAESLLLPGGKNGLFLVRESNNYPGDYSLSVLYNGKVEHYHIEIAANGKLTLDEDCLFDDLTKLVEHYVKKADGLICELSEPLKKEGEQFIGNQVDWEQFVQSGWRLEMRDMELGSPIGKGEFGEVLKGHLQGKPVAVKSLKKGVHLAKVFLQEAQMMTELKHEHLVRLMGVARQQDSIYIVTEFMANGNLVDYLRTRGRAVITKKDQIGFACDTCKGMKYLEEKRLIHRDLAARNILIDDHGLAKVSDFGLAIHESAALRSKKVDINKFPIKWTAPEALRNNEFSTMSDVWSFGILLWEIYSFGRNPYPRIPLAEVSNCVEKGYKMESPEGCPKEAYGIMTDCWNLAPQERPSFHMIYGRLDRLLVLAQPPPRPQGPRT